MPDNYDESVMIALLPVSAAWCQIELPHLTLVYCGKVPDLKPTDYNEIAKDIIDLSRRFGMQTLDVIGPDIFGDDESSKVDVLRLRTSPDLSVMRSIEEYWNASQHPFNPHVTVGPVGSLTGDIPNKILFDRIMCQWGNQGITTRFTGGNKLLTPSDSNTSGGY